MKEREARHILGVPIDRILTNADIHRAFRAASRSCTGIRSDDSSRTLLNAAKDRLLQGKHLLQNNVTSRIGTAVNSAARSTTEYIQRTVRQSEKFEKRNPNVMKKVNDERIEALGQLSRPHPCFATARRLMLVDGEQSVINSQPQQQVEKKNKKNSSTYYKIDHFFPTVNDKLLLDRAAFGSTPIHIDQVIRCAKRADSTHMMAVNEVAGIRSVSDAEKLMRQHMIRNAQGIHLPCPRDSDGLKIWHSRDKTVRPSHGTKKRRSRGGRGGRGTGTTGAEQQSTTTTTITEIPRHTDNKIVFFEKIYVYPLLQRPILQ